MVFDKEILIENDLIQVVRFLCVITTDDERKNLFNEVAREAELRINELISQYVGHKGYNVYTGVLSKVVIIDKTTG